MSSRSCRHSSGVSSKLAVLINSEFSSKKRAKRLRWCSFKFEAVRLRFLENVGRLPYGGKLAYDCGSPAQPTLWTFHVAFGFLATAWLASKS